VTKLDVQWGYNNIWIKKGDEWKATFATNYSLFELQVMFFGMTNSLATFQWMMNTIFTNLIASGKVAVYLDNILIYSSDLDEHCVIMRKVLWCLEANNLYLQPKKCKFEKTKVEYLGLIISEGQIQINPSKVKAMQEWKEPKYLSNVCPFIGFENFYWQLLQTEVLQG
jgi:hypothetical protein